MLKPFVILAMLSIPASTFAAAPLFDSQATLSLTIEAPMRVLVRKRLDKPQFDAIVTWTDESGESGVLAAKLSPRGNARLAACDFPPLRLEFDRDATRGTPFEGRKRLKMVTHCGAGTAKRAWLWQEYGIYRAYNAITEYSYRVRMLDVSYEDSKSRRWRRRSPAFLIEPTSEVAARLGMHAIEPEQVRDAQFNRPETANNLLFQYLIGNTDFAVKKGPSGETCCHNGRVIAPEQSSDGWVVLPYDYDQAGIINTSYALPDERLSIRRVTSRYYRGFCWQNDLLPDTIARFNEQRQAIATALVPEALSAGKQKRAKRYIDRFYEIVNDSRELGKRLTSKCRGAAAFSISKTRTEQ